MIITIKIDISGPEGIEALRGALRLTQPEFAEALGVHVRSVQAWEAGKTKPREHRLEAMRALALDQIEILKP